MTPALVFTLIGQYGPVAISMAEELWKLEQTWANRPALTPEFFTDLRAITNKYDSFFLNPGPNPYRAPGSLPNTPG